MTMPQGEEHPSVVHRSGWVLVRALLALLVAAATTVGGVGQAAALTYDGSSATALDAEPVPAVAELGALASTRIVRRPFGPIAHIYDPPSLWLPQDRYRTGLEAHLTSLHSVMTCTPGSEGLATIRGIGPNPIRGGCGWGRAGISRHQQRS